jgi:hypothetical protein
METIIVAALLAMTEGVGGWVRWTVRLVVGRIREGQ